MGYGRIVRKYEQETWLEISGLGGFLFGIIIVLFLVPLDYTLSVRIFIGLILVEMASAAIKLIFHRKRPTGESYTNVLEKIDSGSFPSVHAARSMLYALSVLGAVDALWCTILSLVLALLVGISRIRLKKHYATDVLGGYILGTVVWVLVRP